MGKKPYPTIREKYTDREKKVLNTCRISNVEISYSSPFTGRQPKKGTRWEEVKINEKTGNVENPSACENADKLHFRRSTVGHAWRAYAHKTQ